MSDELEPLPARGRLTRVNASPALVRAVERIRRGRPGDDRFGDELSTSGPAAPEAIARTLRARTGETPSVARQVGMGALQVWQAVSEGAGRGRGDHDLAILFTDLVGFSSWALEVGDTSAVALLRAVDDVQQRSVTDHGGRVVKRLGDGLMAVFVHPADAVGAALDAEEGLEQVDVDGHVPRMRAGVHYGRPRKLGGDYLGVDVNVAARVADEAKPGQLLVTEAATALLDTGALEVGKAKRLRAKGAPPGTRTHLIRRRD